MSLSIEQEMRSNVSVSAESVKGGLDFGSTFSKGGLGLYISVEMERQMVNCAKDLAQRAVMACGERYNFDAMEAIRLLGLENVKVERQKPIVEKKVKEVILKASFPLPYNGEFNETCCFALRQNNGLYTQCQSSRKGGDFCKACQVLADKNEGIPEYGTIQQRRAVGIFEYTDPKGRKPVSYTKVMKKYKVSEEQVLAEAGKLNMEINAEHFVVVEADTKRGRPAAKKEKATESKGPKGRPKKTKKVLEIAGEEEDLFAAMVADAVSEASDEEEEKEAKLAAEKATKKAALEEEKAAKKAALEEEKAAKKAALEEEKAAKKAALEEEKAAKKAALEAKKAALEAKKAALEEEKAAKKATLEAKKPAAKNVAKKETKTAAPAPKEEEEEGIHVETKKVDGKKYLVSTTGIVYDYSQWKNHQEQVVIGKWNASQQKIEFNEESDSEGEESADEYEE
jgi:chemotaxis protein histidine kinase CheA